MPNEEIGNLVGRVSLDAMGFQEGVATLRRQLSVLKSEFKAAVAGLGEFATEEDKLRLKSAALAQQIQVQRAVVETLERAYNKAVADSGEFSRQAQTLAVKLNNAKAALADMETELRNTDKALTDGAAETKALGDATAQASAEARRAGGIFSSLGGIIKSSLVFGAVYEGLNMVADGFRQVVTAGISFNANMEQNQVAFTQMLGSAQKAQQLLQQITQFAASTPFELPQVEDLSKKLLAFGFSAQQVIPMLKDIGDAAAGLGLGAEGAERITLAIGQMQAKGRVQADEMLQLVEAGIPAWQILADAMGVSQAKLQQMVSKGLVPADKAIQALLDGMEKRFPNMMEQQSKTFTGLLSNIADSANVTLGAIMKPAFDWLEKDALPAIQTGLQAIQGLATGNTDAFAKLLPPSVRTGFKEFAASVQMAVDELRDAFGGDLGAKMSAFFAPLKSLGPAVGSAFAQIGAGIHMIAAAVAGDKDRFGAIANALNIPPSVQQAILNVIDTLKQAYQIVAPQLKATFQDIVTFFKTNWPEISAAVRNVMSVVAAVFNAVWPIIKFLVLDTLKAIMDGIKHAVDGILAIIKLFADIFTGNWGAIWGDIKRILGDALAVLWDWLQVWGLGKVLKFFGSFGRLLGGHVSAAWDGVKGIFRRVLDWLYTHTIGRFTAIRDGIAGAMNALKSRLSSIWDGVTGVIRGAINRVIGAINRMIDGLNHLRISVPNWVPVLGGKSWGVSIPHIPALASGGIVTAPTTALVGEAGPEAVTPLSKLPELLAEALQIAMSRQPAAATPVGVTVPVYLDGREIARYTVRAALDELTRQQTVRARAAGRPV